MRPRYPNGSPQFTRVQFQGEDRRHPCTYSAEYLFQSHIGCHNLIYFILKKRSDRIFSGEAGGPREVAQGEGYGEPRVRPPHHVDELDQL